VLVVVRDIAFVLSRGIGWFEFGKTAGWFVESSGLTAKPMAHVHTIALIKNHGYICFILSSLRLLLSGGNNPRSTDPGPALHERPSLAWIWCPLALRQIRLRRKQHRRVSRSQCCAPLKPTHENQYDQNDDYDSKPAARVVTPVSAVGPGGQRADQ
jgi:hypothetical protein